MVQDGGSSAGAKGKSGKSSKSTKTRIETRREG